jgi:hypothetical protein
MAWFLRTQRRLIWAGFMALAVGLVAWAVWYLASVPRGHPVLSLPVLIQPRFYTRTKQGVDIWVGAQKANGQAMTADFFGKKAAKSAGRSLASPFEKRPIKSFEKTSAKLSEKSSAKSSAKSSVNLDAQPGSKLVGGVRAHTFPKGASRTALADSTHQDDLFCDLIHPWAHLKDQKLGPSYVLVSQPSPLAQAVDGSGQTIKANARAAGKKTPMADESLPVPARNGPQGRGQMHVVSQKGRYWHHQQKLGLTHDVQITARTPKGQGYIVKTAHSDVDLQARQARGVSPVEGWGQDFWARATKGFQANAQAIHLLGPTHMLFRASSSTAKGGSKRVDPKPQS